MEIKKLVAGLARRVDAEQLPVEAVSVYQKDRFVVGHRWVEDRPRNIYSHTKSFTVTAVGLAIADGVLSLDDKPADFFPEALPERPAPEWERVTLEKMLPMGLGVDASLLMEDERRQGIGSPDYVRFVFSHEFRYEPGTHFHYSNANTYLAGRMVEKATGKDLSDYLNERVFAPLEIPVPRWERCPKMHPFGAGGMWLRNDDMLKLGRLYLNGGMWRGLRLLDPDWIALATSKKLDTPPSANGTGLSCGYGFQFWMCPYPGSYRADGKYGQLTVVFPEAEVVVGVQCAEAAPERTDAALIALHEELLSQIR